MSLSFSWFCRLALFFFPLLFFSLIYWFHVSLFLFNYHHIWLTAEVTCLQGKQPYFFRSSCLSFLLLFSILLRLPPCAVPCCGIGEIDLLGSSWGQASFVPGLPSEKAFFTSGELLTAHGDIERLIALLPNLAVLFFIVPVQVVELDVLLACRAMHSFRYRYETKGGRRLFLTLMCSSRVLWCKLRFGVCILNLPNQITIPFLL